MSGSNIVSSIVNPTKNLFSGNLKDAAVGFLGGNLGTEYLDGQKKLKDQKTAAAAALDASNKTLAAADQAFNKANPKTPDISTFKASNKAGLSDTLLTGIGGVKAEDLLLGKKTLLGG